MAACEVCHALAVNAKRGRRLYLEFTPDDLQNSALADGCQSCFVLLSGIRLMQDDTWSFVVDVSRIYGYGLATDTDTLTLEVYFVDERPRLMLEFFTDGHQESAPSPMLWSAIRPRTTISGHPLSQEAIRWVNSMLSSCCAGHLCQIVENPQLPARILALDRSPDGAICVKVVENQRKYGKYAALSHCWGSHPSCTTTTKNLGERLCGIPWAELPQTFQDAIQYCLMLDIFYLWIDALCILQDDSDDWQLESAKMADIYQNSHITLAATASALSSASCFPKQPLARPEPILGGINAASGSHHILVRRQISHWDKTLNSRIAQEHPLLTRGWAFQERVLSPRVLHFCKEELVWECGAETRCECGSLPKGQNLRSQFALAARSATKAGQIGDIVRFEGNSGSGSDSLDLSSSQRLGPLGRDSNLRGAENDPASDHSDDESRPAEIREAENELLRAQRNIDYLVVQHQRNPVMYSRANLDHARTAHAEMNWRRADRAYAMAKKRCVSLKYTSKVVTEPLGIPEEQQRRTKSILAEVKLRAARLNRAEAWLHYARRRHNSANLPNQIYDHAEINYRHNQLSQAEAELRSARSDYDRLRELVPAMPTTILDEASDQWHGIVDQYSALLLTRDTDRLPALSGLAERMAPLLGEYRAGLWEATFLLDIIWRADKLVPGLQRPSRYKGPSWSWVSTDAKVSFWAKADMSPRSVFGMYDGWERASRRFAGVTSKTTVDQTSTNSGGAGSSSVRTNLEIMSCMVQRAGKNPFGEVSSALLVAEGMFTAARLRNNSLVLSSPSVLPIFEVEIDIPTGLDMPVPSLRLSLFADYVLNDIMFDRMSTAQVFLLIPFPDVGLVLVKTQMAMKGMSVYRRIGILKLPQEMEVAYGIDLFKVSARAKVAII